MKQLESNGIGRPSTYSNIINTIYSRNYTSITTIPKKEINIESIQYKNNTINNIEKKQIISDQKNKIILTELGKQVLSYLETNFSNIINCEFTALVENDLDKVSIGKLIWTDVVKKVYLMFSSIVEKQIQLNLKENNIKIIKVINYKNESINILNGKYGYYLSYKNKIIIYLIT